MQQPLVNSFVVTLKRGFAGTKEKHIRLLKSIGLQRREQIKELRNTPGVRGLLDKVKHMIRVETDQDYAARKASESASRAPRPPIKVSHKAYHT